MDIMPSMALSLVMCAAVYLLQFVQPGGAWMKLIIQIIAGAAIYGGLAWMFRLESFTYLAGMGEEESGEKRRKESTTVRCRTGRSGRCTCTRWMRTSSW